MAHLRPFQLLEINIISAQDLEPLSKNLRTYATAWVHPKRKLSTSVDSKGHNNPTWNDKFVFRVDEDFLRTDTSAVMIEIYGVHWLRDSLVGTVRVLVGNLVPPPTRHHHPNHQHFGMRFVALQVRRPSGRPQGILNIGVGVLDSSMRSMPLYTQLSASAVGFRDLMDDNHLNNHGNDGTTNLTINNISNVKPILRRSKSERSERVTFDDISNTNGSIIALKGKASSFLSGSESTINPSKEKRKQGKASSVISGAELREKPKERDKRCKSRSVIGSIISKEGSNKANVKSENPNSDPPKEKWIPYEPKTDDKQEEENLVTKEVPTKATSRKPISKFDGFEFGGPKGSSIVNGKFIYGGPVLPSKARSFWSDSEVGPSPSEVAATMARERYDNQSSVLDGWSLDESVEGLRSKLERWRTELPPICDRSGFGSSSYRSTSQHVRRHSDDGGIGLFSCFGNIYGYECQCVCGKPPQRRSLSSRFQSPSASAGRSFL